MAAVDDALHVLDASMKVEIAAKGGDFRHRYGGAIKRAAKTVETLARRDMVLQAVDKGKSPVAELKQILRQVESGGFVVHADAGCKTARLRSSGQTRHRDMAGLDQGDQLGVVGKRRRQDDAVARHFFDGGHDAGVALR